MKHRITSLGEVLWDVFPDGPRFGGAPANVACHAAALGAEASMVSCVGEDDLGNRAVDFLEERGVNTSGLGRSADLPTGTVQVELDRQGKPSYEIAEPVAWDAIEWSDQLARLAENADAVCFGTLAQRSETSRRTIQRFLEATREDALRVFDVNLRKSFYTPETICTSLARANVLKLNDEELPIVAQACGVTGRTDEQLGRLCAIYELRAVAMTRGSKGAFIVSPQDLSDCPGFPSDVQDSVGAGDAYTAALIAGTLQNRELDKINEHACRVAAYVCTQSGATPPLPDELRTFP